MAFLSSLRPRLSRRTNRSGLRRTVWTLALLLAGAIGPERMAGEVSREYQLKAVLLFNLAQFVEWPPAAFASPDTPLVIGVIGRDPFGTALDDAVRGEKIAKRPIVVNRCRSLEEAARCQILFFSSTESAVWEGILSRLKSRPILTVADREGFIKHGGIIYLYRNQDDKIRLHVNLEAAKARNLAISAKLLRVAEVVDGK